MREKDPQKTGYSYTEARKFILKTFQVSSRAFFVFLGKRMPATLDRDLPRANVRRAEDPFPAGGYVTIQNVPIFAEHRTKSSGGRDLHFGRQELQAVVDRCNRRINETGDYAAISIGHTSDPGDAVQKEPEVIGGAGPFRLGLLGEPGARQRYCILADFHVQRDKVAAYNAHPRRSPELWLEDSYEEMFLDPISLLGAEAPRLDMGLAPLIPTDAGTDGAVLYSAMKSGRIREKYAAAGPSCASVFVPAAEGAQRKYAAEPAQTSPKDKIMLAPEDIRQIVDAIESLDWVVAVKDMVAQREYQEQEPAQPAVDPLAPDAPPGPEAANPAAPTPPAPPTPEAPAPEAPAPAAETPAAPPALPADDKPEKRYAAGEDKGASHPKLEDLTEEEIEKYLSSRRAKKYAAEESAPEGTVAPEKAATAQGSVAGESQTAEKAKYSKMESRIAELEADRSKQTDEIRKAKLQQLRYHRAFDLEKHIERCRYGKMTDSQFSDHCEMIGEMATPTLANQPMPFSEALLDAAQPAPSVRQQPERYTKELVEKATQYVLDQATAGRPVAYETVLENMVNGRAPE